MRGSRAGLKMPSEQHDVAIVDYGLGNLFSIQQACRHVGLSAVITSEKQDIANARAAILPGVGAFGDAIAELERLDLIDLLRGIKASGKPMMGICLGMQLLMSESREFGQHGGLDLIPGSVRGFREDCKANSKIPQIGWNRISRSEGGSWNGSLLENLDDGTFMYFVHSYYVVPEDTETVLAITAFGGIEYCSALRRENIFGCQFHPERSGAAGLKIYASFKKAISGSECG